MAFDHNTMSSEQLFMGIKYVKAFHAFAEWNDWYIAFTLLTSIIVIDLAIAYIYLWIAHLTATLPDPDSGVLHHSMPVGLYTRFNWLSDGWATVVWVTTSQLNIDPIPLSLKHGIPPGRCRTSVLIRLGVHPPTRYSPFYFRCINQDENIAHPPVTTYKLVLFNFSHSDCH